MQAGYAVAYLDESIFALTPHIIRSIFPIGSRPTIKIVNNPRQKLCVFLALFNGKTTVKISDKINNIKFISFIKRLRNNHKKLCIVVDNARWHLTRKVMSFIKEHGIKIIRLLAYSPELNPIEQYWKNIKNWLATKIRSNLEELKKHLCSALKRTFLIPKICYY